jgi:GntR family transcriptional regulator
MNDHAEPEVCLEGLGPIHRQIADQIRGHILLGGLRPGDQLPTIRAVAVALAVNPRAVERAYTQLEYEGLVTTEDGSGIFVTEAACRRRTPQ